MSPGPVKPLAGPSTAEPSRSHGAEHYRRQLETVCNNATLALFMMDAHQHCTYMNPAAEKLTGYSLAEVRGRALHDVIHHTRPDGTPYPMAECPIDRALPLNHQEQGEDLFVHKDGSFYPVAYTASPLREGGTLVGTIIEVRDITREKQIEREREEHLRQVRELDEAKTLFFSSVSHEFRTPLTLMLAPTEEALADPSLPESQKERWRLVHRNELRLLKLVNTLLDFSRLEAGRAQASYEPVDLPAFTRDLASLFTSAMERAGLRFSIDCPPLPEPLFVDREMWEKIVLNLLSNALKFTFEGEVALALRWRETGVELEVRDTGVGIPAQELPRIFDRFHQVKGSRSRTYEGTGIGLALVKELAAMHGGDVTARSEVGTGTAFTVRLPAGSAHLRAERIIQASAPLSPSRGAVSYIEEALGWLPAPALEVAGPARRGDEAGSQRRVLVVDDNADMRHYLRRILSERWDVEVVEDGVQALEAILARRPDLVVSDIMMPGLDGMGLVRELRSQPATRTLPVLLVSARAGEEATAEGLSSGANDYIVKPFSARELVVRVAAQLEIARIRDEATLEAEAARAEAEAANRAKDEFLAMLGHELRNPLAPILTALQLMRLRDGHSSQRERTVIERQVNHVVQLVDDLLDVSRIARGKVQLRKERLELAEIVAKAIEMASPLIEERRHRLEVDVPSRGASLDADPTRLGQVISNLLTNAAKYTQPGGHLRVSGGVEDGEIVLRVRDNGMGIAPTLLPHVFDLFVQGPQSLERSQGGLGLGLTLVKSLTTLHGGRVSARSEGPGRGSEFIIHLPSAKGPSEEALPEAVGRSEPHEGSRPRRVLVVDDNQDAAETLGELLETFGYQVRVVHDGPAALIEASAFLPDAAVLDIGLPVMDGYELGQRLRAEYPDLRLIALTGYGQESDRSRSRAAGFDRHLVKPVDADALNTLLEELTPEPALANSCQPDPSPQNPP